MERKLRYPSVSQKINGQSCLPQRHFQDSPGCSYAVMRNIHGMSWRGKGVLLPAPCLLSKESSTVTPMPITIGAPVENRKASLAFRFILGSSVFTLSAPFRRVQLLLQSQNDIIKSGHLSHPYKGIINCFSRTIRNEGLFSLWRGHGAGFVALSTKWYCRLQANDSSASKKDRKTAILAEIKHAFAGCAISLIVHPFFYAETRLANDVISITGQRRFSGGIDVCRKTLMTDGILGLYRGWIISQIAVVTHTIILFVFPATIPQSISYQSNFLPGGLVKAYFGGLFAAMAQYPMYTLSRRMMMSSGEGESAKYKNAWDAFSQILKKEGVKSFYRGGGAGILTSTVRFVLGEAIFCSFYPRVGTIRKETGNDDGGIPASIAIKLTWRSASVGSHDSEK